ncbi:MAG: hypothetical protein IJE40_05410, partial [Clostridia bacterium]|nr:hypothetical protein [Clostridia bacterium]
KQDKERLPCPARDGGKRSAVAVVNDSPVDCQSSPALFAAAKASPSHIHLCILGIILHIFGGTQNSVHYDSSSSFLKIIDISLDIIVFL